MKFSRGFTLIEILLTLAILGIAVTIVMISFSNLNSSKALEKGTETVLSVFSEARALTLSGAASAQYGVHLEGAQVVLFRGSSYVAGALTNVATPLNLLIAIRNIAITGGGANVIFDRLTGSTPYNGTFEVYLKNESTTYRTIQVSATGLAEEI